MRIRLHTNGSADGETIETKEHPTKKTELPKEITEDKIKNSEKTKEQNKSQKPDDKREKETSRTPPEDREQNQIIGLLQNLNQKVDGMAKEIIRIEKEAKEREKRMKEEIMKTISEDRERAIKSAANEIMNEHSWGQTTTDKFARVIGSFMKGLELGKTEDFIAHIAPTLGFSPQEIRHTESLTKSIKV